VVWSSVQGGFVDVVPYKKKTLNISLDLNCTRKRNGTYTWKLDKEIDSALYNSNLTNYAGLF